MSRSNFYYPVTMLLIILLAGYLIYTGYFEKPQVDLAAYQKLCDKYLAAPAGQYSDNQMQLLVYKIDYLFPGAPEKLAEPAERALKTCGQKLSARLKQKAGK